jgi:hypothetical protein
MNSIGEAFILFSFPPPKNYSTFLSCFCLEFFFSFLSSSTSLNALPCHANHTLLIQCSIYFGDVVRFELNGALASFEYS